jgi:predicted phage-related endonuclease
MSTALAFDTLQYAKRLKQAGFTEEQAEVQAEGLSELIHDHLATKQDIKELEKEIKNVEERLTNKINDMGYKIIIKLGGMMIAGVVTLGAFLALIKFLA